MTDLPQGWSTVPIGEVAAVNPRKHVDLKDDELVTFVPMAAVDETSGTILSPTERAYGDVARGFTQFRENDVIFAKITPSMENGKSAVARNLANGIGIGSTELHVLRSYGAINPEYLWRFVRQKSFRDNAQLVMSGAVGQQRVPAAHMKAYPVPLPPMAEQQRIILKLEALGDRTSRARAALLRIPALVERYRQRLLTLACSGVLTADWRTENSMPPGQVVPLSTVALNLRYGSAAKSVKIGEVPVLRMGNIQNGKLDWSNLVHTSNLDEIKKYELLPGDVLFNRTNSAELVGKTALYRGERPAIYAGYLIRIRCAPNLLPAYLTHCLNSPAGRDYCRQVKSDSINQSNINARKLAAFRFTLPSLAEQAEIVARIEYALAWLDRLTADQGAAVELIQRLDEAVLARAFSGRLSAQHQEDESSAALLDRSRADQQPLSPRKAIRATTHLRKNAMAKTVREILGDARDWLTAQQLFERCNLPADAGSRSIELFYEQLRELDRQGVLDVRPVRDENGLKLEDQLRLKVS